MPRHSLEPMVNSYLLDVIKVMTSSERQGFLQFLKAYSADNHLLVKLFEQVLNVEPTFEPELLSKQNVYLALYGTEDQVHGKLEKLMSELNKHLRTYLLQRMYVSEENEILHQIHWAKWQRERGLFDRAKQTLSKLKSIREAEQQESLEKYQLIFLYSEEEHKWESTYNRVKGDLGVPQLIQDLDLYFLNLRTALANRFFLQQKVAKLADFNFSLDRLRSLENTSIQLAVNVKITQMLQAETPNEKDALALMDFLIQHETQLSEESLDHAYAFLRNSCTLLINAGHLEFVPIQHKIHLDNLKRGYFFINDEISPNAYVNIVQIATRANEISWAKEFTESFRNRLVGGDADQFFYKLNMAQCFFSERAFEAASNYVPEAPSNSHYYQIAKRLELKIYYELQSDLLIYKIDAYRKYIERTAPKVASDNVRELYLNFLKILHQLAQSPPKDKARSARLIKRIEEKKFIAERSWLLEKARELG